MFYSFVHSFSKDLWSCSQGLVLGAGTQWYTKQKKWPSSEGGSTKWGTDWHKQTRKCQMGITFCEKRFPQVNVIENARSGRFYQWSGRPLGKQVFPWRVSWSLNGKKNNNNNKNSCIEIWKENIPGKGTYLPLRWESSLPRERGRGSFMENLVCCFQRLSFSLWAVGDMRKIVSRGWKWDDVCFR